MCGEISLDPTRLENVKHLDGGGIRAACPACRAAGSDKSGEHLLIKPDGKFGCATHPDDPEHRKEIFRLAGTRPAPNGRAKRNDSGRHFVCAYDYRYDKAANLSFRFAVIPTRIFHSVNPTRPSLVNGFGTWTALSVCHFICPHCSRPGRAGRLVFICEGEKDVLIVEKAGFAATCNPGGAGKWQDSFSEILRGADVTIIADKDVAGRDHARLVARKLHGVAKSVRVIELPDTNGKAVKDAADFFRAGGSAESIRALADATPEFVPATQSESQTPPNGEATETSEPKHESAATRLVKLAEEFGYSHDQQSRPFVRLNVNTHREVWPVNSTQFRNLLAQMFYKRTRTAINRNALSDAIATLAGRACYDSPEKPAFLRVAPHGQNILIDLGDPQWRVVEVTPTGWRGRNQSPVVFLCTAAMRSFPSPAPASEGSLAPLWDLLNVLPAQRPLVAGALLNAFQPAGPYFVTNFVGEQGSAKSCAARTVRMLIDPNEVPLVRRRATSATCWFTLQTIGLWFWIIFRHSPLG